MSEDMRSKYPNLLNPFSVAGSLLDTATDVVADTVSGTFGPPLAAGMSLIEQAVTSGSVEDMRTNKDKYANLLNYTPRTEMGAQTSEYLQGKLGEGVTKGMELYNEYGMSETEAAIKGVAFQAAKTGYDKLPEQAQLAGENILEFSEILPPVKGARLAKMKTPNSPVLAATPTRLEPALASALDTPPKSITLTDSKHSNSYFDELDDDDFISDDDYADMYYDELQDGDTPQAYDPEQAEYEEQMLQSAALPAEEAANVTSLNPDIHHLDEYAGGLRDGGDFDDTLLHLRNNKVAEYTVLRDMDEFSEFPDIVVEQALNKFKRPIITTENMEDAFVYLQLKQRAENVGSEIVKNPKLAYVDIAEVRSDFATWAGNGRDPVDKLTDYLEDVGGYYRAFEPTNAKSVKSMHEILKKENGKYNKAKAKYEGRPDVQLYKGIPKWGSQAKRGKQFRPTSGQERIEITRTGKGHGELGYGLMSTTGDPNFVSYQDDFGGKYLDNVVETTIPAADYEYLSYNMPQALYDSARGAGELATGAKARAFDAGITGGPHARMTSVPHSVHLEFEKGVSEPQKLPWRNLRDNPTLVKSYSESLADNEKLSGSLGLPTPLSKTAKLRHRNLEDYFGVVPDVDNAQVRLYKVADVIFKMNKITPSMAKVAYNEWKYTLQSIVHSIKYTRGQGTRGSYVGKLDSLLKPTKVDGMDLPNKNLRVLERLAEHLPEEKAANIRTLHSLLSDLSRGRQSRTALEYKEQRLPTANAIKELTGKFNEGGLVDDQVAGYKHGGDVTAPKEGAASVGQDTYLEWEDGDTLTSASKKVGISVALLKHLNGGSEKVFAGESLKIPASFELMDTVEPATHYDKDDQDFPEYRGTEKAVEATPNLAMAKEVTPLTEPVVEAKGIMAPVVTTHSDNMIDWFATSEGTKTTTVNGVVTYPYGVETGKFAGVDRELYKNEDGTYKDKEFAKAVLATHIKTLKAKHTDWATYPKGVKEALTSYKWNYGLGVNVLAKAKAAAKLTDPIARKAKFKEAMTSMLDTFGAKDKARGAGKDGAMTGLVKRRADDYNRAAADLGYTEIATYSLNNKGTGAEAVYKAADGTVIATEASTYKIHTNNKAVTDKAL